MAVILFFAARLSKRDTEKSRRSGAAAPSPVGRWSVLDRIGFLELVPYGAMLLVHRPADADGAPHVGHHPHAWRGRRRSSLPPGSAWAGSSPAGPWWREPCWFIITQTPYMTARINLVAGPLERPAAGGRASRRSSPCWPSAPAACWAWGWATARQKFLYVPEPENDFVFPIVAGGAGIHRGGWWCCSCSPCSSCGATGWPSTPGTSSAALTHRGHYHPAGRPGFPEHRRGHQSDPQHRHLPALLQLRRHGADDPAGGDGHRIEHIQTDPCTQK